MAKCPNCGKPALHKARVEEKMFGVSLGTFSGFRCRACKETFLDEDQMVKVEASARAAGVWGLGRKAMVVRSGNSLVIRIPAELVRHLKLHVGTRLFVHPEGQDRIVVDIEE